MVSIPATHSKTAPVDALAYVQGAAPVTTGLIRRSPGDFRVTEQLDVEHTGEGEHLWIEVEKTRYTSPQIARFLADHFGLQVRDVGYSGLKDKHAVTRQWFSVPTPNSGDDLPAIPGVEWLHCKRHSRKLRRGTHQGNAFVLTLHEVRGERDAIESALVRLRDQGMPNYFGEQRFSNGRNLEAARRLFKGARLKRTARSMALSATRSMLFNAVLSERVRAGSWNQLLPGEAVMLDASHSVFPMPTESEERQVLETRLQAFDIHPSGPLPGTGKPLSSDKALALEESICMQHPELLDGLQRFGVKQARRALRVRPQDLSWSWSQADTLVLAFALPSGAFATSLLREFINT